MQTSLQSAIHTQWESVLVMQCETFIHKVADIIMVPWEMVNINYVLVGLTDQLPVKYCSLVCELIESVPIYFLLCSIHNVTSMQFVLQVLFGSSQNPFFIGHD